MLQLADGAIRNHAIGCKDDGIRFFAVCHLTRELVPYSHVFAAGFFFRAWGISMNTGSTYFVNSRKIGVAIYERPVRGQRGDEKFAALACFQSRKVARRQQARHAIFQESTSKTLRPKQP